MAGVCGYTLQCHCMPNHMCYQFYHNFFNYQWTWQAIQMTIQRTPTSWPKPIPWPPPKQQKWLSCFLITWKNWAETGSGWLWEEEGWHGITVQHRWLKDTTLYITHYYCHCSRWIFTAVVILWITITLSCPFLLTHHCFPIFSQARFGVVSMAVQN